MSRCIWEVVSIDLHLPPVFPYLPQAPKVQSCLQRLFPSCSRIVITNRHRDAYFFRVIIAVIPSGSGLGRRLRAAYSVVVIKHASLLPLIGIACLRDEQTLPARLVIFYIAQRAAQHLSMRSAITPQCHFQGIQRHFSMMRAARVAHDDSVPFPRKTTDSVGSA